MRYILPLILITLISSCAAPDDELYGDWGGGFVGDDDGQWELVVDFAGDATGSFVSNTTGLNCNIYGKVDNLGNINATLHSEGKEVGYFEGQLKSGFTTGSWGIYKTGDTGHWN
jgi:hypothetical protein